MALLLAMYQKMRLIREKNQLVLEQSQYSSKLTRVEKNIERTQKRYTSLFQQLKSQAQMMQNEAKVMFQDMAGLGAGCVDPYDYSGNNGFIISNMTKLLSTQGMPYQTGETDENDKPVYAYHTVDENTLAKIWSNQQANGGQITPLYEGEGTSKTVKKVASTLNPEKEVPEYDGFTQADVDAFNWANQQARMAQSKAQMWAQNANTQYGNNVSIWLQAQEAQLEAEQDAALEPLNYKQTMYELEKNQKDARLKRIQEELESYEQLCSDEAQKSAPSFGIR